MSRSSESSSARMVSSSFPMAFAAPKVGMTLSFTFTVPPSSAVAILSGSDFSFVIKFSMDNMVLMINCWNKESVLHKILMDLAALSIQLL
jgi:hypothetical protein